MHNAYVIFLGQLHRRYLSLRNVFRRGHSMCKGREKGGEFSFRIMGHINTAAVVMMLLENCNSLLTLYVPS